MKRVVIVRHAKAVPYGYEDDFNRDLRDRGVNDALLVCGELKKRAIKPCAIISSPAVRALKTARIFAENLEFDPRKIRKMEAIYEGLTTFEFIDIIKDLPEDLNTVFFFGHNPEFLFLTGNLLEHFSRHLPTCGTVGIDFEVDKWNQIEAHTGKEAFRLFPKMLK